MGKVDEYNADVEGYNKAIDQSNKKHFSRTEIMRRISALQQKVINLKSEVTYHRATVGDVSTEADHKFQGHLKRLDEGLQEIWDRA